MTFVNDFCHRSQRYELIISHEIVDETDLHRPEEAKPIRIIV